MLGMFGFPLTLAFSNDKTATRNSVLFLILCSTKIRQIPFCTSFDFFCAPIYQVELCFTLFDILPQTIFYLKEGSISTVSPARPWFRK